MTDLKTWDMGELTLQHFEQLVGEKLDCVEPVQLKSQLMEAKEIGTAGSGNQSSPPYVVVFKLFNPAQPAQGTYRFRHSGLGIFDIFLVPVEQQEDGVILEAIVSN